MTSKARIIIALAISGLFLLADRWLKYLSLFQWTDKHLVGNFFGWLPFQNPGIAFGLPLPVWITIALTAPFIFLVGIILAFQVASAWREQTHYFRILALSMIFLGGISNLIDRLFYRAAIDYFLIFTSVINLADLMIVAGFALIFISSLKKEKL